LADILIYYPLLITNYQLPTILKIRQLENQAENPNILQDKRGIGKVWRKIFTFTLTLVPLRHQKSRIFP
jgi:hypothetical protein